MSSGAFTFVLHSHIPYARMAGRWPHGEEWVFEAVTDTYLPLVCALRDLAAEGVRFRLTLSVTPVLAEQLADRYIIDSFDEYLADQHARAQSDVSRFDRDSDAHRASVARWYVRHYGDLVERFRGEFGRDIIGALRALQDDGYVELATSAATHGYLPLFARDSSIHAQVRQGVRTHRKHFGQAPEAFWLPECAYRPSRDGRPGLEEFLAAQGLRVFFTDSHTVLGGRPSGRASDGLARTPAARPAPFATLGGPSGRTTFQPYFVHDPRVAALGRNVATGQQVWSASHGYPGDPDYREFHSKDSESGMRYWRVTGPDAELDQKAYWDPWRAFERTSEHARHFAMLVEAQLREYHASSRRAGIISAAYDTELFGHWWFEGIAWLKDVLRLLARSDIARLTGAAEYLRERPPEEVVELPEGSWGQEGTHFVWNNDQVAWMWPVINERQARMEEIVSRPCEGTQAERALDQLARELFLLESSDWPFLVTTGQARTYAEQRFNEHVERFDALADQLTNNAIDFRFLDDLTLRDNVFENIEPLDFAERQGLADNTVRVPRAGS
jgi:1,4-alpha-glucan branching enzyme